MKHWRTLLRNVTAWVVAFAGLGVTAQADIHEVRQIEFEFVPRDIEIEVGDSVRWIWSGGVHTVTEGDTCEPGQNLLFDAPLTAEAPEFVFQFDEPGLVDYICRPHCVPFDMVGTVTVVGGGIPCEDYRKAKFKCRRGKLKIKITMTDNSHDGEVITVNVTGDSKASKNLTISGKKAKGKIKKLSGKVTASIEGCPEFDKPLDCG